MVEGQKVTFFNQLFCFIDHISVTYVTVVCPLLLFAIFCLYDKDMVTFYLSFVPVSE